ncbi:sucrase ferredoxin [Devosia ginsengisoli]|uniref:sucrase ferredoxin n=1 Tax=Devosia ginsengisoli TaxID=400770 RepID=UPI0026EB5BBD|nr:sucrase ferredoxin [Devosia ginsengisoli]MCR6670167.1 hypothetical protein [Devosia ginsengisoli]
MSHRFCTDLAIARGEPLEGTGAMAERHLFLAWPKGKWRRPRYQSVDMDEALQAAMQGATGNGRYVGLIDRGEETEFRLWSFPDMRSVVASSQAEAAALIAAWGDGTPLDGEALPRRVILCCTDAKIDSCCARYGFPLYKALRAQAAAHGFDVLQCTHIGGCHFAPSVIVMPQRHRYGRLTPAEVPALLETLADNRIYLSAFKGRPDLQPDGQLAEIAAMRWAEARGVSQAQVRIVETLAVEPGRCSVRLRVGDSDLLVRLRQQAFEVHGNCRDLDAGPGKMVDRWLLEQVQAPGESG